MGFTIWPKACHTLAHGVPWVYIMGFKIWLKACHIHTHGSPWDKWYIRMAAMHLCCVTWHAMSNKYPFTGYLL